MRSTIRAYLALGENFAAARSLLAGSAGTTLLNAEVGRSAFDEACLLWAFKSRECRSNALRPSRVEVTKSIAPYCGQMRRVPLLCLKGANADAFNNQSYSPLRVTTICGKVAAS